MAGHHREVDTLDTPRAVLRHDALRGGRRDLRRRVRRALGPGAERP